jgi:hypothetical protein
LQWEARSINFNATSNSHLIKFLPMDNDTNWTFSLTDTTGALYMGIDSISIVSVTGFDELSRNNYFQLLPNPNNGSFKLQYNGVINKPIMLYINDIFGKLIDSKELLQTSTDYENTLLNNGFYFYNLMQGNEEVGRGKFVVVK